METETVQQQPNDQNSLNLLTQQKENILPEENNNKQSQNNNEQKEKPFQFVVPNNMDESLHLDEISAYDFQITSTVQQKTPLNQSNKNLHETQSLQSFHQNFKQAIKKEDFQQGHLNFQNGGGYPQPMKKNKKQQLNVIEQDSDEISDLDVNLMNEKLIQMGSNIKAGKRLVEEEKEILQNILEMGKKIPDPQKFFDLFEALYMEIQMRVQETFQIFDDMKIIHESSKQIIEKQQDMIVELKDRIEHMETINNRKNLRQAGKWNQGQKQQSSNESSDNKEGYSDIYDWEIDIDLITNIAKGGWGVSLSLGAYEEIKDDFNHAKKSEAQYGQSNSNEDSVVENVQLIQDLMNQQDANSKKISKSDKWSGATVAVVGLYDKGKTFVLNNLTQTNLPSGKKCTTKGVSFKNVNVDGGTNLILVDTAGSYSPVKIESELSIVEKETTENFLQDLVFEISDYFICVVNDFTSLDQRYLDKISRSLQNSTTKTFREIIVIHNLKEVESQEILEHVWENQVTQIYKDGRIQNTKVASFDANVDGLVEKQVIWFKTQYTRHICIVNDDCKLGRQLNPWVFSLLRYWLKSVFVPVNRNFSVINSILQFSALKLSNYFKTSLTLAIEDTEDKLLKKIKAQNFQNDEVKIPQITIDSSGLVNSRPDSFTPSVDIIANDSYYIYMDVPGLSKQDIQLYRQNVISVVKGNKKKPYQDQYKKLERNERKYGEFTLSFRIPEIYERKWKSYNVENGVLCIQYDKDSDDSTQCSKMN